jgi:cell wall-associated NlpC family hydrolase
VVVALLIGLLFVSLVAGQSSSAYYGTYSGGTGQDIVAAGEQYLGWGYGHGPGQFMCSGFTSQAVAEATGVSLPLDPAAQMSYGWEPRRMKPGDLMFFSEDGYSITHVGIYAGDGLILHASDYFYEVVESDYTYIEGFVGVRRIRA